jgi:Exportin 1-like protein
LKADATHYVADFLQICLQAASFGSKFQDAALLASAGEVDQSEMDVMVMSLQNFAKCAEWVPIHLIVNDRTLSLLGQFLGYASSDPQIAGVTPALAARTSLRNAACDVVVAILNKRIADPVEKLTVLEALGPGEFLSVACLLLMLLT